MNSKQIRFHGVRPNVQWTIGKVKILYFFVGDDLSRINRKSILQGLKNLQKPDGSFMASKEEQGKDYF